MKEAVSTGGVVLEDVWRAGRGRLTASEMPRRGIENSTLLGSVLRFCKSHILQVAGPQITEL